MVDEIDEAELSPPVAWSLFDLKLTRLVFVDLAIGRTNDIRDAVAVAPDEVGGE